MNFQITASNTTAHITDSLNILKVVDHSAWFSLSYQREAFSIEEGYGKIQGDAIKFFSVWLMSIGNWIYKIFQDWNLTDEMIFKYIFIYNATQSYNI